MTECEPSTKENDDAIEVELSGLTRVESAIIEEDNNLDTGNCCPNI